MTLLHSRETRGLFIKKQVDPKSLTYPLGQPVLKINFKFAMKNNIPKISIPRKKVRKIFEILIPWEYITILPIICQVFASVVLECSSLQAVHA